MANLARRRPPLKGSPDPAEPPARGRERSSLWPVLAATPRWWPDPRCAPLAYLTGWRVPPEPLALTHEPKAVEVFFELENIAMKGGLADLEEPAPALLAHVEWIVSRLSGL